MSDTDINPQEGAMPEGAMDEGIFTLIDAIPIREIVDRNPMVLPPLPRDASTAPETANPAPVLLPPNRPLPFKDSDPKLPFKKAGRDYCALNIEVALLSGFLNDPCLADKYVDELTTEDFSDYMNKEAFQAILYLVNNGGDIGREPLEAHLSNTVAGFDAEWQEHIDQIYGTSFNEINMCQYIRKLKRAAEIRGADGYCIWTFNEAFYAGLLKRNLPPTKCVASEWFQYGEGVWSTEDKNLVRAVAVASINPNQRAAKRITDIVQYVEAELQVSKTTFTGGYKICEGRVYLNVANGVLVVAEDAPVVRLPHGEAYHFTQKLEAAFVRDAPRGTFDRVLQEALPDPDDRRLLQMFAGYILWPGCEHEIALVCYGPGGTGKSTVVGCLREVLGDGLCGSSGLEELCKSGSYSLPTLKFKMLNLGSELCGTEITESANFKKLVSGEWLNVRQIYGAPEEMQSTCKLLFLSNEMPKFRLGTDAEMRRLRILHFKQKPASIDIDLKNKLKQEASGILNWMVEGLVQLLREKRIPDGGASAQELLQMFNKTNDPVGAFLADQCLFGPAHRIAKGDLFEEFKEWSEGIGAVWDKMENHFFKTLRKRHPELKDERPTLGGERKHCIRGIKLKYVTADGTRIPKDAWEKAHDTVTRAKAKSSRSGISEESIEWARNTFLHKPDGAEGQNEQLSQDTNG